MSDCNCDNCYEKYRRLKNKFCNCCDCYEKNRRLKNKDCNFHDCCCEKNKSKQRGCSCRKCEKKYNCEKRDNCCEKKYICCYEQSIDSCISNHFINNTHESCNATHADKNEKSENENIIIINITPLQK